MTPAGGPDPRAAAKRLPSASEPDRDGLRVLAPGPEDFAEIMASTLQPCPFCGGRPFTMLGFNDRTEIYVARVACNGCHATVRGSSRDQAEARKTARGAWDRRVPNAAAEPRAADAEARAEVAEREISVTALEDAARIADHVGRSGMGDFVASEIRRAIRTLSERAEP